MTKFSEQPGFIPPYQDAETLADHLCISVRTIDEWTKIGRLPPPRVKAGKRLWKWKDVEKWLDGDSAMVSSSPDELASRITEATRAAIAARAR
jgi:predicted site-specific integrase-resolvase